MARKKRNSNVSTIYALIAREHLGFTADKAFNSIDGQQISDLKELAVALKNMSEETFRHHSSAERNDFATWVKDVFSKNELAEEIKSSSDKTATELVILRHISKNISYDLQ